MALPAVKPLGVEEFLDWDSGDDRRYELVDGVPVALAAPRPEHQILAGSFARYLSEALDERPPCTVRVEPAIEILGRDDACHVADLAVTCRPHRPGERMTPEPILIVEILSPTTENRDRKTKLPDYRAIPSVEEIVLLDSQQLYCEVHRRLEDGWLTDLLRDPESRLRLKSCGFDQPLSTIYANVTLEA